VDDGKGVNDLTAINALLYSLLLQPVRRYDLVVLLRNARLRWPSSARGSALRGALLPPVTVFCWMSRYSSALVALDEPCLSCAFWTRTATRSSGRPRQAAPGAAARTAPLRTTAHRARLRAGRNCRTCARHRYGWKDACAVLPASLPHCARWNLLTRTRFLPALAGDETALLIKPDMGLLSVAFGGISATCWLPFFVLPLPPLSWRGAGVTRWHKEMG